jgi:hypothetical protein
MNLGSHCILRRVDSGFVNLSPVCDFFAATVPDSSTILGSVVVSRGSPAVCGTWVPLSSAQMLFQDRQLLSVFLSDHLHERFPQALQDFHTSKSREQSFVFFGPNFSSTQEAKRQFLGSFRVELPARATYHLVGEEDLEIQSPWEDHWLFVTPPPSTSSENAPFYASLLPQDEEPLSPTEEEMFQTLCSVSDWESPSSVSSPPPLPTPSLPSPPPACPWPAEPPIIELVSCRDRKLRRSKRITPAAATRPRTRLAVKNAKSLHTA